MNQVKLNSKNFFFKYTQLFSIFFCFCLISLSAQNIKSTKNTNETIITGAQQYEKYIPLLSDKKVGIVTNQTGILYVQNIYNNSDHPDMSEKSIKIDTISIVDFLLSKNIKIEKIFSPEHGFRGKADAGEQVKDEKDSKTNIHVISLYGKNKKPTTEQLKGVEIILFDLQDVGVRFYTYISTLHYVMEAAAENNIPVIVLDRPNPNAHYIDGPVLKQGFESFVGMHRVPVVYGMTIGEYALMINGEKWLKNKVSCDLTVIKLQNYNHKLKYSLPVNPSPNLRTDHAINLYPSLCFFEGTNVSVGRGTDFPFEMYGSPFNTAFTDEFIPQPNKGDKNPKYKGQICYGEDLRDEPFLSEINLEWLLTIYYNSTNSTNLPVGYSFFNKNLFFDKLAGTDLLRKQILARKSEQEIKLSWKKDLEDFKIVRSKYLLYPD
ncbi:exo-beta-N-acetylmuramidase NamZ domain-containing protein [Apibacter sp. HY039]|uniref:exo-beta-N-acetylmuramidase NamZ family protein n=1 Tax=Apibacter sp. HY039 TaxID=2501476 RepID=UPI00351A6AA6